MKWLLPVIVPPLAILVSVSARAGFIELGLSGNHKRVNLSEGMYDESRSLTGSISYLFDEMSALELSFTDGNQKRFIGSAVTGDTTTTVDYRMVGLDFILTLGSREAFLRPYAKVGVAHILEKRLTTVYGGASPFTDVTEEEPATVPSVGAGFRIALSKELSLKAGVDAWTSKSISDDDYKWDVAGRAGLSWMF